MSDFLKRLLLPRKTLQDEKIKRFIAWTYYMEHEIKHLIENMSDEEMVEFSKRVSATGLSARDAAQALSEFHNHQI